MPQRLHDSPESLGAAVARDIVDRLHATSARPFLLGCPSGRSAQPVYRALAELRGRDASGFDTTRLRVVMMDEYLVPGDGPGDLIAADPTQHYSCLGFARREIAPALGLLEAQIWLPDPADPAAYDARIAEAGGIDLFLLASGSGDGHVAFNPPGSGADSQTRIVTLAEQTRRDNMATFPAFATLDEVPRHGVTVGIDTIARHSHAVAMLLWGEGKRLAWQRISAARGYDPAWPATVVAICRDATLHADVAAAR